MARILTESIFIYLTLIILHIGFSAAAIPMVVNTWKFQVAARKAYEVLTSNPNKSSVALDALTQGCKTCEDEQCGFSVGYGGNPDENGETTLDALIFDGNTMDAGGVGGLRRVKNPIAVARHILDHSEHSLLVGDLAVDYATRFNFIEESLQTNYSLELWQNWTTNNCQPNFWKNVVPDPKSSCGPYNATDVRYDTQEVTESAGRFIDEDNHDTIGMIVISQDGHVVAGTSTNGLRYKFPGLQTFRKSCENKANDYIKNVISSRVGDSPIPGAGAYADSEYGAACATGNGDIMMRFSPSFLAVEQLRLGATPAEAAHISIARIAEKYPSFSGAVIVVDKEGNIGADCNGMADFYFSVANEQNPDSVLDYVLCDHDHNFGGGSNGLQLSFSVIVASVVVNYLYKFF